MGAACSIGNSFTDEMESLNHKLVEIKKKYPWAIQLSDSQLLEIHAAFAKFDRDGNGTIEKRELEASMRSCGLSVEDNSVEELLCTVDTDGDGKIQFEEFLKIMARRILETDGKEELKVAFTLFDPEGTGYIDREEATKLLTEVGKPFAPDELACFLASAKADKDGRISLEAFLDMPCWQLPSDLSAVTAKSRTSPETSSSPEPQR